MVMDVRSISCWRLLACAGFLFGLAGIALAQPQKIDGYRMPKPPVIDGRIDPAEWGTAPSGQGSFDQQTGQPSPEPMQFWLGYDDTYVYFAAKLTDHEPH